MRAAFFHDHRFGREATGVYLSNGAFPYGVFARYLRHFESLVVVAREEPASRFAATVASGPGVEMACLDRPSRLSMLLGGAVRRSVRGALARVDCAIARLPSTVGRIACEEAISSGTPWMVEVAGDVRESLRNHGSLAGKLLADRCRASMRSLVRRAPFALYVSDDYLQRRYPCGGRTVGCSNVAIEVPQREVLERRLARIGRAPGTRQPVLGLVGSLNVDYKGHETALRALAVLGPRRARLRCLGGGDPTRWRRLAAALGLEDRVEFCGPLPGGQPVLEWMDELDVLLVPSLTEGIPRALIEGMSRALPAVGAAVGGIPELLEPERIHAPGDPRALAASVARLSERPHEARAQALRNWRKAAEYARPVLEARRDRFLSDFRAFAQAVRGASPSPADGDRGHRRSPPESATFLGAGDA